MVPKRRFKQVDGEDDDYMPNNVNSVQEQSEEDQSDVSVINDTSDNDNHSQEEYGRKRTRARHARPRRASLDISGNVSPSLPATPIKRASRTLPSASLKSSVMKGGKEAQMEGIFGYHVDKDYTSTLRSVWGSCTLAPSDEIIDQLGRIGERSNGNENDSHLETNCQNCFVVSGQDFHAYLSDESNVKVIVEGQKSPDEVYNLRPYEWLDTSNEHKTARSLVIFTGMTNWAIDWAPTQPKAALQYVLVGGSHRHSAPTGIFEFAPGPGHLQLWELDLLDVPKARLSSIIVTDFGHVWDIKWCAGLPEDESHVGLVAVVFGDGILRIWRVLKGSSENGEPEIRYLKNALYTLQVPEASITCFDWIDKTKIATGTSIGMYVVWDLSKSTTEPVTSHLVHACCMTKIVSCGPSNPLYLATTGWDCEVKITNYSLPEIDEKRAQRQRTMSQGLAWDEVSQAVVAGDDSSGVRAIPLRLNTNTHILNTESSLWSIVTAKNHPFLACTGADGTVVVFNIIRKMLLRRKEQYINQIYQLDYNRNRDTYRFIQHIKPQEPPPQKQRIAWPIHYPETNITKAAWNDNPGYAAWLGTAGRTFVRIDRVD